MNKQVAIYQSGRFCFYVTVTQDTPLEEVAERAAKAMNLSPTFVGHFAGPGLINFTVG
jgi:hypothetical protein